MAYKKKSTPKSVAKVFNRIVVMKSIDTKLGKTVVYGVATPVTAATLGAKEALYNAKLDEYNLLLSKADSMRTSLTDLEKDILNDSEIVTTSAAANFGLEGIELVDLGVVRKKDRKHPKRKKKNDSGDSPDTASGK